MNKFKTIIVDDERLARVNMKNLLAPYPDIEVIAEAGTVEQALELIRTLKPGLLFLDIQLMGETGFDLLEKLEHPIRVVFVTAYDEYAVRAFEINALDYLLKPVNPDRLERTLERIRQEIPPTDTAGKKFEMSDSVFVNLTNRTSRFLKISSIIHITPVGNYTKLHAGMKRNFIVLKTMKQWESELPAEHFIRIHRATIVNMLFIDRVEYTNYQKARLYIKDIPEPFDISRGYFQNLRGRFSI